MRQITDHIVSGDPAVQLQINVLDEPGQGGACHQYSVLVTTSPEHVPAGHDFTANPDGSATYEACFVKFQEGPVSEFGRNGITDEALLAILIDRQRHFQAGPFPSASTAIALECANNSLYHLQSRTRARIARGVEGTNQE